MEGTMAVVTQWAAPFAPRNWAFCNGQLLAISTNSALFSLLGTTYGGNGQTTFALPDLRGRSAVGAGLGLSQYYLGEVGGSVSVTLMGSNIPPHTHSGNVNIALNANNTDGSTGEPGGNNPGALANGYSTTSDVTMTAPSYSGIVGIAGSSVPYSNLAPFTVVNFIICQYGIYPSRN